MTETRAPIGIFYGSSTCYTEMAAEKIRECLGIKNCDLFNISDTSILEAGLYDYILMGIPTWDYGELQEDWEEIWDEIDELELDGKKVALFGLGDQVGYPEWFLDAMGYLHTKLQIQKASLCGYWPATGYTFENSQALTDDKKRFVGLALDEENEFNQSQERIERWCVQITNEFGLDLKK